MRSSAPLLRERAQSRAAGHERYRELNLALKLGGVGIRRRCLWGSGPPSDARNLPPFSHSTSVPRPRPYAAPREPQRAIDVRLIHGPVAYGLNVRSCMTTFHRSRPYCRVIASIERANRETALAAFEHRARPEKPVCPMPGGGDARLRRPSGCMRLVHAPSARYSMIPPAMLPAMPSARPSAGGRDHSLPRSVPPIVSQHARWMKACLVDRLGTTMTAAGNLDATRCPPMPRGRPARALASRQYRRITTALEAPARLERVIEVFAMRVGAIDQRGGAGIVGHAWLDRLQPTPDRMRR